MKMWTILVPDSDELGNYFSEKHHRVWDEKVCEIAGGLILNSRIRGRWKAGLSSLVIGEKMIPVDIACSEEEIEEIALFTKKHYNQEVVITWVISDCVKVIK